MGRKVFPRSLTEPRRSMGAHTVKHRQGYIMEYCPEHPHCNLRGMVMQHRLIMEEHIGRFLTRKEVVHHHNKDKQDNRIENLVLLPGLGEHIRTHKSSPPALVELVRRAAADPKVRVKDLPLANATVHRICKRHGIHWVSVQSKNLDPKRVYEVLRTHSRPEALRLLDVSVQYLWNKFPEEMRKTATRKLKVWGVPQDESEPRMGFS